jgi:hypothetical protein
MVVQGQKEEDGHQSLHIVGFSVSGSREDQRGSVFEARKEDSLNERVDKEYRGEKGDGLRGLG